MPIRFTGSPNSVITLRKLNLEEGSKCTKYENLRYRWFPRGFDSIHKVV